MANTMYDIDLRERVHSKYLHNLLGEAFMEISGVDIEDWPLLKLATAVKKMCYPDEGILVGDPYEVNLNLIVQVFWYAFDGKFNF
jgi:nucleolar protein 58